MQKPSRQEVEEWQTSPVTKWVISKVVDEQNQVALNLTGGGTLSEVPGLTAQLTSRAVGEIAGLSYLVNQTFLEDFEDAD